MLATESLQRLSCTEVATLLVSTVKYQEGTTLAQEYSQHLSSIVCSYQQTQITSDLRVFVGLFSGYMPDLRYSMLVSTG